MASTPSRPGSGKATVGRRWRPGVPGWLNRLARGRPGWGRPGQGRLGQGGLGRAGSGLGTGGLGRRLGREWPGRTVTWVLAGYLVAVAVGAGMVGRSAADTRAGIAFGLVFLLAAGGVAVTFRRFSQRAYRQQEDYRRDLFDAEIGTLARLREAGQIREDLIASVSHEFRTPLTAIRGSAATLLARADQMRREDRDTLLRGVVEHSERLSRLLEDMLLASSAAAVADAGAVADVSAAVARFTLDQSRPPVVLEVASGLAAYVDAAALDHMVQALSDHVRTEARRDRPVHVRAQREAGEVVVEVGYLPGRREDVRRLFEPFGSVESARTGRPASLALYVVRRLVEAHGGRASAVQDSDGVRVRIGLRALRPREPAPATAGAGRSVQGSVGRCGADGIAAGGPTPAAEPGTGVAAEPRANQEHAITARAASA